MLQSLFRPPEISSCDSALGSLLQFGQHLVFVRKLARLQLGIDQLTVHRQFETPTAGRLKFESGDLLFQIFQQFGRQTDGLWFVVSSSAIT
jgi:hypothetical protein